jgi:hypothetical protein
MKVRTANTPGRIALAPGNPAAASGHASPIARLLLLGIAFSIGCGGLLSSTRVAQAGWTDWLSPSDSQSQKAKKTVKKAGIRQPTKKPATATGRMIDSVTSAPKKMVASSMSALLPGKKTTATKSRTVPRKLVSDQNKPSTLQRLFSAPAKDQPLTVTEWMAQPRPKP